MIKKIVLIVLLIVIVLVGWLGYKKWSASRGIVTTQVQLTQDQRISIIKQVQSAGIYIPKGVILTNLNSYDRAGAGESEHFLAFSYTATTTLSALAATYRKDLAANGFTIINDIVSGNLERIVASKDPIMMTVDLHNNTPTVTANLIIQNL